MRANISNFVILLLIISFNSQSFSSDKDIALHIEGEYMSVNLKDVPINAIFRILNRLKGIAVEGDVSMLNQNITVKFKNLTFEQSLKRILNRFNHSLYFNSKGDVISVFLIGKKIAINSNPKIILKDNGKTMLLQKDELKTIDYGHLTELLDTYIELKNEDKHLKHQILRRISRIRNPQSVKQLASYAQIAIEEKEDSFLSSISEALSNIGSKEAVGTLRRILISSPEGDAIGIISKSLSRVNNSDSIPLLKDIIIERLPGNESAIKAMMNMGGLGIYELSELIGSDKSGYTKAKFLKAIESKEFDKEAYAAFEKLAKESSEDQDIYKTAASKLKVTEN